MTNKDHISSVGQGSRLPSKEVLSAVDLIKTAILQSQERAVKAVNQEQLALYYGIGRFVSANTRNKNWGKGVIESISSTLRAELPGLRGFSATNMKNMRLFYEAWRTIERNSSAATDELVHKAEKATKDSDIQIERIRQLQLTNLDSSHLD